MKLLRFGGAMFLLLVFTMVFSPGLRAQTIFSVNALGYVDLSLSPGSNFITHAFADNDHTVTGIFPTMPHGSYFALWDPVNQTFGTTNHYTSSNGWSHLDMELKLPDGALMWVPQATTVTLSGELIQSGVSAEGRQAGMHLLGVMPRPLFFNCADFAGCMQGPPPHQTMLCQWNAAAQQCVNYTYFGDLGPENGWYNQFGDKVDVRLSPGEGGLFYVPTFFLVPAPIPSTPPSPGTQLVPVARTATNFTFRFDAAGGAPYAVLRATNLPGATWDVVHEDVTSGTTSTVVLTDTNKGNAFHRVVPPLSLGLFRETRLPGRFGFQFYVPTNGTYQVERRVGPSISWNNIATLSGLSKGIASFTDSNAIASRADYRMRMLD